MPHTEMVCLRWPGPIIKTALYTLDLCEWVSHFPRRVSWVHVKRSKGELFFLAIHALFLRENDTGSALGKCRVSKVATYMETQVFRNSMPLPGTCDRGASNCQAMAFMIGLARNKQTETAKHKE